MECSLTLSQTHTLSLSLSRTHTQTLYLSPSLLNVPLFASLPHTISLYSTTLFFNNMYIEFFGFKYMHCREGG